MPMSKIDWQQLDTVLLDMDGTLLDLAFDNYFWQSFVPHQYAAAKQMSEQEARQLISDWIGRHHGTLNWYCLDFWSGELGLDITSLKQQVADRICYRPGAESFLQWLSQSSRQVIMVTNAHPDALALKVGCTGIDRYFQTLVSSHQYGAAKEDARFWARLQAEHPFDPARTLLVDDALPVLRTASRYGITQTWSILHPDSSMPPRESTDPFPCIDRFEQVYPLEESA